jgi:hypothetical protein
MLMSKQSWNHKSCTHWLASYMVFLHSLSETLVSFSHTFMMQVHFLGHGRQVQFWQENNTQRKTAFLDSNRKLCAAYK